MEFVVKTTLPVLVSVPSKLVLRVLAYPPEASTFPLKVNGVVELLPVAKIALLE
jgi:hypothetical protein